MPVLRYSPKSGQFALFKGHVERERAFRAGYRWHANGYWVAPNPYAAFEFIEFADDGARQALRPILQAIAASEARHTTLEIPGPWDLEYLPFQKAGIARAAELLHCLIGDEMGLGKTIQALGVANLLRLRRLLVICPAGLRLNWAREIAAWHLFDPGTEVVLSGSSLVSKRASVVTSYSLLGKIQSLPDFDMIVIDEAHYVKNPEAWRTQLVLGTKTEPGLIHKAPRVLCLTGTPMPNRVNEIYPVIRALCPECIDSASYSGFLRRFAVTVDDGYSARVVGIKRERELAARLRAHWMIRRLKDDVLTDLPPKRWQLVVFPADGAMKKILKREAQFDARTILKHGAPVGSALPEIRREMGIAKAPLVVEYCRDLLENVSKIVIFAHHLDVSGLLAQGLERYRPVLITGQTSAVDRQAAVDQFQNNPARRVFVGNIVAAGTGITLTAAQDVVFAECSWVPGENEQAEDRLHRVGQRGSVHVHQLVVEHSLDAAILGAAARKRGDIRAVLDGKGEQQ